MIEIKDGNSSPTQKEIAGAINRYQKLLDHHKINKDVQKTAWVSISKQIQENPMEIVSEIQGYWESTFGPNGNGKVNPDSSTADVARATNGTNGNRLGVQVSSYNRRRNWRIESVNISKEGSKIKARKKKRKTNGY